MMNMRQVLLSGRIAASLLLACCFSVSSRADTHGDDFSPPMHHGSSCEYLNTGSAEGYDLTCEEKHSTIQAPSESVRRSLKSLPIPPDRPAESHPSYSRKSNRAQRA